MKYSQIDAIKIGIYTALAIVILIILIIKLLPQNRRKYSDWNIFVTIAVFVIDIINIAISILS
jgi:hypothetical protein